MLDLGFCDCFDAVCHFFLFVLDNISLLTDVVGDLEIE